MFFAFYLRPVSIGLATALGTFIGDAFFLTPFGLTNPLLSLIAGVPANFVGFYLIGWWFRKFKGWNGFVLGTFISLFVGNFIAAAGLPLDIHSIAGSFGGWGEARITPRVCLHLAWHDVPFNIAHKPSHAEANTFIYLYQVEVPFAAEMGIDQAILRHPLLAISIVFIVLFQFTGLGEALAIASPTGTKEALAYISLACSAISFLTWTFYALIQR